VFANLLTNGGDHDLRFVRCDLWNSCTLNSSDTWETCASQAMLGLIRFVRRCPLNLEFVIESHAAAIHEHFRLEFMEHFDLDPDNRYVAERFANANPDYWKSRDWEASLTLARERFQPSISHKLTIDEWLNLSEQRNVPCLLANPALWNLTLAEMLDSNSVQELLNLLYTQHLHRNGECLEVPGQNSQVCPTLCGNDAPPSEATVTGLTDSASGVATDSGDAAAVDHDELPEEYEPDDPNDYPMLASDNPYYNSDVDMDQQSEEFWDSL